MSARFKECNISELLEIQYSKEIFDGLLMQFFNCLMKNMSSELNCKAHDTSILKRRMKKLSGTSAKRYRLSEPQD